MSDLSLNRALTTRSATSSLLMAPQMLLSSVKMPLPVAGSLFSPPGRMIVHCIKDPVLGLPCNRGTEVTIKAP